MLEAVELPAGVSHLATGLADVDGDAFALERKTKEIEEKALKSNKFKGKSKKMYKKQENPMNEFKQNVKQDDPITLNNMENWMTQ